ncbi:MAG TPA: TonB-dependent receptor [Sphingomicrobium sp.]|nr:TonB-dependent receptor [Sphingomicrobium sp.]
MKKFILLASTAFVMPTAAFAQSTGTVATEEETIVITGTRINNGVDGFVIPDTTKAKGQINQELIARQSAGQTILNTINLIPGVNFTNSDPYGSSGGSIRIRGFDGNRISLTFDGVPLNDSGNYAIFSNQQLDPELIEQVNVGLGVTDIDSPTASAAGGTINYRTVVPSRTLGARFSASAGTFDFRRFFGMVSTGEFGPLGTRAWASYSVASNDKFKGPGGINKKQFNARAYQTLGNRGDFLSLAVNYNRNRNNQYRNPNVGDLRGILGAGEIPAGSTTFPDSSNPLKIGYFNNDQFDAVEDFDNLSSCNRTIGSRGVRQDDNPSATPSATPAATAPNLFGSGPNGTGVAAPAINGSTANNPLNSNSCTNFFGVRINPSDTGNVRGSSRFTLADGILLTIDPSFQYVLANGGGSTAFNEIDRQLRGSSTGPGVDLNGDGDFLDRIRVLSPNNTNTKRLGLTSSLIWEFNRSHRVRVAYTYDRAHHRQTGEYGFLNREGHPLDPFGGRDANSIRDAAGNILQQRDRTSIALLNQISGQYIGRFLNDTLRIEAGVRRPFFKRKLDQNCFTFASGSGFAYCSSEALGTTPLPLTSGNFIVPNNFQPAPGAAVPNNAVYAPFQAEYKYGKLLPSVGFTYKVAGPVSVFGSYAKGYSSPRTDNLYRRPTVEITPEETNAFDLGARYTNRQVQAQATIWKIDYKNRIVSSFDPDLGISLDRNVGEVKSWGLDGSVAFKPIPQLSLLALASYIKAELQENVEINVARFTTPAFVLPASTVFCDGAAPTAANPVVTTCATTAGKRVTETPKLQFGGRAEYDFGIASIGIQAKRVGSRFATDTNDVKVKGYTLVDLDARISMAPVGLERSYFQLNVQNLLDERYFGNIGTQINNAGNPNFSVGSPRSVLGTLNFQF